MDGLRYLVDPLACRPEQNQLKGGIVSRGKPLFCTFSLLEGGQQAYEAVGSFQVLSKLASVMGH